MGNTNRSYMPALLLQAMKGRNNQLNQQPFTIYLRDAQ
jgi:hypothetical protein